ncbi:1444_t:CDS:1, partial [Cetraspora pellucida]
VFDPTKPIYTNHENIEEFLIYFEAYATSKDWNNNKKKPSNCTSYSRQIETINNTVKKKQP